MGKSEHSLVVAIDGGGTRCRIAACRGKDVLAVETGPANASTDFGKAVRQIAHGLELLAARMGCSVETLSTAPAFVGLAGVSGPDIADRLRAVLPFKHVRIEDDRVAAARGVLGHRDGAIGHCGTGSFYAAQTGGKVRFAGGWGPVLGDEASAQWVGRIALGLALETLDGRLQPSALSERLIADLEGAAGILRFVGSALPSEMGALAPLVTEFAGRGDSIGGEIMRRGAGEIVRALKAIGWQAGQAVCLTGGIGPHYISYLPEDLRAVVIDREGEPIDGAIALARDLAQEIAHACS
ncbi:ATPase [Ruegeria pomeroyi]|uniref:ATPase n=1 Tax=Ruegeria pomeroyi TaxID=89184 RepID=A0A9Q3WLW1_9RHOB|nr:BadF/BadG/BcrA/BcrD ATPase family protein [Ruegeria pomeroyi]MCE8537908.1 ATPase [Ruegeria pomeroyi]